MKRIMAFVLIIGIVTGCITTSVGFAENEDNAIKVFDSESGMGKVSGGKVTAYDKEHTSVYMAEPSNTIYFYAENTATVASDVISFDFCENNTGVFGLSVLRTRRTLVIPIKENDHSGGRLSRAVDPMSSIFEPLDAVHTACIFGYNSGVNIAALIGAPDYKTSAPLHAAAKAVP